MHSEYDSGGAIGKRYRRHDEIGTPFCLTIDHQSLEDRTDHACATATRWRRSGMPIDGIAAEIERRLSAPWHYTRSRAEAERRAREERDGLRT